MDYIVTQSGRVGHIPTAMTDDRILTTLCGQVVPESEIRIDNSLDVCSTCQGKWDDFVGETSDEGVDTAQPETVESETQAVETPVETEEFVEPAVLQSQYLQEHPEYDPFAPQ